MHIIFFVEIGVNAELFGSRADAGNGDLCRLLHDVAERTGDDDLARAWNGSSLDRERCTADSRPRKTVYEAYRVSLGEVVVLELSRAEVFLKVLRVDLINYRFVALCNLLCNLAHYGSDRTLEISHTRL